jgi:hypothetical protein
MSLSKSRVLAVGLLTAGVGAAVVLPNAVPQLRNNVSLGVPGAFGETAPAEKAPPGEAGKKDEANPPKGAVRVQAPHTEVLVDKERGKVTVKAPHTDVRVDPDERRVQVRAPYVDLDIRW